MGTKEEIESQYPSATMSQWQGEVRVGDYFSLLFERSPSCVTELEYLIPKTMREISWDFRNQSAANVRQKSVRIFLTRNHLRENNT